MAEEPTQIPVSIPAKFLPLYADARDAPIWDDGTMNYYDFDEDANPIDADGVIIPIDMLHLYGHIRKRYYVYYGGRGGGKSEGFALIAIIKRLLVEPHVILFARELQSSLRDSLYQTLKDWIEKLGLSGQFEATEHELRCLSSGGRAIFKGLKTNAQEVKSTKGLSLCVIDEAANISSESFRLLAPTIRLEKSELWISFNTRTKDDYVYKRFISNKDDRCCLIKVNLPDNPLAPKILLEEMESSRKLAEKTGDWDDYNNTWRGETLNAISGGIFKPENIKIVPVAPICVRWVRGWDFASSAVSEKNPDPDFTAGGLIGITAEGLYVIKDLVHFRDTPDVVERVLLNTTTQDGLSVEQSIPIDPGQAGKAQVLNMTRKLSGYRVHSSPESGPKTTRAEPFASQVNCGNVVMVSAPWNDLAINQMKSFNGDPKRKDDAVDCFSRSFNRLQVAYTASLVNIRGL